MDVSILAFAAAPSVMSRPIGSAQVDLTDVIFDFATETQSWPSIDDVVMGGVSSSTMVIENGAAIFRGIVSFDNDGGFASVRSRPMVRDLSAYDGLLLRVRGDGKSYSFRIWTTASFDGVAYQAPLTPPTGEWKNIFVSFADFEPVRRGRTVAGHPPLDPARVTKFGLTISRQKGPFRIEIARISASRADADRPASR